MPTRVGVGRSLATESSAAGAEAAAAALSSAGLKACDFAFMFATVEHDMAELLRGVRSVTGDAPLTGSSAEGVITQDGPAGEVMFALSGPKKGEPAVGVMVFASDEIRFRNYFASGLKENSRKAGEEIGRRVAGDAREDDLVLWMFLDRLKVNVKEFFTGVEAAAGRQLPFCGGLSGDNFILGNNFQFHNDRVASDSAACALLSGRRAVELGVSHGCLPLGLEKTITRAQGKTVYEIDGVPAWNFFKQYLDEKWTRFTREITTFLDFGIRLPDELATDYDRYIIRAPVSQNPDGSLNFATEMPEGTKLQVVRRDADKTSLGAKALAERIKSALGGRAPLAMLHIDCAARGKMFFGEEAKEKGIDVMQDVLGKRVPWLGVYTCGEIAPIKSVNYLHNQTVVLCALY
jgi:hypothetical protein